jgi:hypothetical protein
MQSSFVSSWDRALSIPTEGFRKRLVMISLSRDQVFLWHREFVNGRETVQDEPRSGLPAPVKTSTEIDRSWLAFDSSNYRQRTE